MNKGIIFISLFILTLIYFIATLPHLADYPFVETAQMGTAAPAYKLSEQGIYGNDLYRGFYRTELYNYEYMPLYPLFVAMSYELLGLGMWQGRLVSVFAGYITMILTFALGRRLFDAKVGLLAAATLCLLPITVAGNSAGRLYPGQIPLLDFARVLRYDSMVPVWVLSAALFYLWAHEQDKQLGYFLSGCCVGLATQTHLYGTFILVPFGFLLLWRDGWGVLRRRPLYLLAMGWMLLLLPWVFYVLQDVNAFQGQLLRHQSRFGFSDPAFYLQNVLYEPFRYVKFVDRFRNPVLWPRPGFWLMIAALIAANRSLWRQARVGSFNARFLFLTLPLLTLLFALLVSFKRYTYIVLQLPFLALQTGFGILIFWQWARRRGRVHQFVVAAVLLIVVAEGVNAIRQNIQQARQITPYLTITNDIRQHIPSGSRIMMLHDYWLGFSDYDVYSWDLVLMLTDPAFQLEEPQTLTAVMQAINPDFVLAKEEILRGYLRHPELLAKPSLGDHFRLFDQYLTQNCQNVDLNQNDPVYGNAILFDCTGKQQLKVK